MLSSSKAGTGGCGGGSRPRSEAKRRPLPRLPDFTEEHPLTLLQVESEDDMVAPAGSLQAPGEPRVKPHGGKEMLYKKNEWPPFLWKEHCY